MPTTTETMFPHQPVEIRKGKLAYVPNMFVRALFVGQQNLQMSPVDDAVNNVDFVTVGQPMMNIPPEIQGAASDTIGCWLHLVHLMQLVGCSVEKVRFTVAELCSMHEPPLKTPPQSLQIPDDVQLFEESQAYTDVAKGVASTVVVTTHANGLRSVGTDDKPPPTEVKAPQKLPTKTHNPEQAVQYEYEEDLSHDDGADVLAGYYNNFYKALLAEGFNEHLAANLLLSHVSGTTTNVYINGRPTDE